MGTIIQLRHWGKWRLLWSNSNCEIPTRELAERGREKSNLAKSFWSIDPNGEWCLLITGGSYQVSSGQVKQVLIGYFIETGVWLHKASSWCWSDLPRYQDGGHWNTGHEEAMVLLRACNFSDLAQVGQKTRGIMLGLMRNLSDVRDTPPPLPFPPRTLPLPV